MALFPLEPAVQETFTSREALEITLTSFGGSGTSAGKKKNKQTKKETKKNKKLELPSTISKSLHRKAKDKVIEGN